MKSSGKKIAVWCLVVSMVMSLSILAFGAEKPMKVTVFISTPSQQPTPDNKIFKMIEEELGVTFEFDILAGELDQKMGIMIASGEYPDLVSGHTRFVDAGALIPLDDLIAEHAPNLKAHYEKAWHLMQHDDGHVYILPNYGVYNSDFWPNEAWGPSFWIQLDVLKEFGYPNVRTLDQYFDLIQKYVEKHPTIDGQPTIGFEILSEGWRNFCLKNPPQHLVGYPNDGGVIVDENSVASVFAHKDISKRYYKKLNEMNALGLIDQETFVLSYDQYIAKLASGRVVGVFDQRWNFISSEQALLTDGKVERTFVACPVTYDESIKDYYLDRPVVNVDRGFGISVNAKDPVRLIKLMDTLLEERWQKLMQWGVEGEDYLVDENGRFYRTQEQRDQANDSAYQAANTTLQFLGYLPKIEGRYSDGNASSPGLQPGEYQAGLKPERREMLEAYGVQTDGQLFSQPPDNAPHYPAWSIPIEDGSPAQTASTKMDEVSMKYLPKAILADPADFDAIWDEYVAEMNKIDIKAYEDTVNAGIQTRLERVEAAKMR